MRISDWSSDVCSSDLSTHPQSPDRFRPQSKRWPPTQRTAGRPALQAPLVSVGATVRFGSLPALPAVAPTGPVNDSEQKFYTLSLTNDGLLVTSRTACRLARQPFRATTCREQAQLNADTP